jgi:hypothetical protein
MACAFQVLVLLPRNVFDPSLREVEESFVIFASWCDQRSKMKTLADETGNHCHAPISWEQHIIDGHGLPPMVIEYMDSMMSAVNATRL